MNRPGFCRSTIFRHAAVLLVVAAILTLTNPAFGGPIHDAAKAGDLPAVQALLKDNPGLVSSPDKLGFTPLHWAVSKDHKDIVEFLLAQHANVEATTNAGYTPLMSAALRGNKEIVELLLDKGADVNAKVRHGFTNDLGQTALYFAAAGGRKEVVVLLLDRGADVNARDKKGRTPLYYTLVWHRDVAKILREHGGR